MTNIGNFFDLNPQEMREALEAVYIKFKHIWFSLFYIKFNVDVTFITLVYIPLYQAYI